MKYYKIFLFLLTGMLSISSLISQSFYQVLADYTGQNRNSSVLENAAVNLAGEIPIEYRSQFKVFEFDSYIYEENMYGNIQKTLAEAESKANQESQYYVCFIYLSSNNKFNSDVQVLVNLPNNSNFTCFDSDFQKMLGGLVESFAKKDLLNPNNELGIINSLSKAQSILKNKSTCCNGGICTGLNPDEIIATLEGNGYLQFQAQEIYVLNEPPGGGVQGNAKVNLTFETFSTNMTLELQKFVESTGGISRIRDVSKANISTFSLDLLESSNYYDLIIVNIDGQKLAYSKIKSNISSGFRSNTLPAAAIYYSMKFIAQVAVAAATDVLIQTKLEEWSEDHPDMQSAFNALESGAVAQAIKDGSVDILLSIIPGLSKKEKAIFAGTYAALDYLVSCATNPSSFSMTTFGIKFITNGAFTYVFSTSNNVNTEKYAEKMAKTAERKGASFINKMLDNEYGVKALAYFYKTFPRFQEAITNVIKKMSFWNYGNNKVLFGPYIQGSQQSYEKLAQKDGFDHFFLERFFDIFNNIFQKNEKYMAELNEKFIEETIKNRKKIFFSVKIDDPEWKLKTTFTLEWRLIKEAYPNVVLHYNKVEKLWQAIF